MIRFKIRTTLSPHYFDVRICDDLISMREYIDASIKLNGRKHSTVNIKRAYAVMFPYAGAKRVIGEVVFAEPFLKTHIVVHELVHCACWYDRLVRNNKGLVFYAQNRAKEEKFCDIVGSLMDSFVRKYGENKKRRNDCRIVPQV